MGSERVMGERGARLQERRADGPAADHVLVRAQVRVGEPTRDGAPRVDVRALLAPCQLRAYVRERDAIRLLSQAGQGPRSRAPAGRGRPPPRPGARRSGGRRACCRGRLDARTGRTGLPLCISVCIQSMRNEGRPVENGFS